MASATKKKPKTTTKKRVPKTAGKARRKPAAADTSAAASGVEDVLDDLAGPERSAPALAEVDAEALEFIAAVDRFKKQHARPFPSWSEILLIVRQLGYRRR